MLSYLLVNRDLKNRSILFVVSFNTYKIHLSFLSHLKMLILQVLNFSKLKKNGH